MMKKYFFLLAVVTTTAVSAQDAAKFGIKGGLNLSKLSIDNIDANYRTGLHIGGLAHIHLSPSFSLQPEVYFSTQGTEYTINNTEVETKLSYINVPLLLQYNFSNGFRLQGGPQLGVLVNSQDVVNGVEVNTSTDKYNNVDFSLPLGISYLGYSGFGVDARYNLGLSNVNEANTVETKNRVFQVGVFYLFDHRHKARSK